jgi:type IV pilus assembly protein PilE
MKQQNVRSRTHRKLSHGFTLIEVMVTVAIIGILAAIAIPSYNDYIRRGQLPEAFGQLSDYRTKMEQYYQDTRKYGVGTTCADDASASSWHNFQPTNAKYFSYVCEASNSGQNYVITATGITGQAKGHKFTINHDGIRGTTEFKGATVAQPCWLTKDNTC